MRLFLLTFTMANNNIQTSGKHDTNQPLTNPHLHLTPTDENPCGYPPFNMRLVHTYMNNQITHYYTTSAIPAVDLAQFQQSMKQHKVMMELIGWDSLLDKGDDQDDRQSSRTTRCDDDSDSDSDSDCPGLLPDFKGIKISPSDIPKL
jgi:hypothetical protein